MREREEEKTSLPLSAHVRRRRYKRLQENRLICTCGTVEHLRVVVEAVVDGRDDDENVQLQEREAEEADRGMEEEGLVEELRGQVVVVVDGEPEAVGREYSPPSAAVCPCTNVAVSSNSDL